MLDPVRFGKLRVYKARVKWIVYRPTNSALQPPGRGMENVVHSVQVLLKSLGKKNTATDKKSLVKQLRYAI